MMKLDHKGEIRMYKKDTVVVSVPISIENNQKLYELAAKAAYKNKTQLARKFLEDAIIASYKEKEKCHEA